MGANRIIVGGDFTSPAGDPSLPPDREEEYRLRILEKALDALRTPVEKPTVFNVRKGESGEDE